MKKIVSSLILVSMLSNATFADCDFSKGITPGPNNTFVYTEECHKAVGKLVKDNASKDKQIADLSQAITLKDLAITKSDQRTQLWMDTSDKMNDRLTKIDETYRHNEWLYFGLGVLTTFAAGYAISRGVK